MAILQSQMAKTNFQRKLPQNFIFKEAGKFHIENRWTGTDERLNRSQNLTKRCEHRLAFRTN
jgi:hypothetical protein